MFLTLKEGNYRSKLYLFLAIYSLYQKQKHPRDPDTLIVHFDEILFTGILPRHVDAQIGSPSLHGLVGPVG